MALIEGADPKKRRALADTMDAYHEDFPDQYHWATGE
jgi:hypothetical protein